MKIIQPESRRGIKMREAGLCHTVEHVGGPIVAAFSDCVHLPENRLLPAGDWPSAEAARAKAFNWRGRGLPNPARPFLATDFDPNNLRVFVVTVPDREHYDDPEHWKVTERPMTDMEFSDINAYASWSHKGVYMHAVGYVVNTSGGVERRIVGYVKRYRGEDRPPRGPDSPGWKGYEWTPTLNIDAMAELSRGKE